MDNKFDHKISLFEQCETGYKNILSKNIKKSDDPDKVSKKRVKMFFKNDYVSYWNEIARASPMSASFATHKNNYDAEKYLSVVTIKKHRNALAKLRLSDHNLHIHSGRQTKPKTPRDQRFCKSCPSIIEDDAHFLFECVDDRGLYEIP